MKNPFPLALLIIFSASSCIQLVGASDLDCMCKAYDGLSERNGSPVDSGGSFCTDGFQNMVDAYAPDSSGTCEERLNGLPSDFCGFPGDSSSSVCSATATERGACAFELFADSISCEWSARRTCSWHEGDCVDALSEWFKEAYGISSTECSSQQTQPECINTNVLGEHCMSYGRDGEDTDLICPAQQEESSCTAASYAVYQACEWHESIEVGRDTTFAGCCDTTYQPPYAGSQWCGSVDLPYVPDGRISSGIGAFTCDDIAGTYIYEIQSREVLARDYGQGLVDTVDASCCVPQQSSNPTVAPSVWPSVLQSLLPSASPSLLSSSSPSVSSSSKPSPARSQVPSYTPSGVPSVVESSSPSSDPTSRPSSTPSSGPSSVPTVRTSSSPSSDPSSRPSHVPSSTPSGAPSVVESSSPSSYPSSRPSSAPSAGPSSVPSVRASSSPSSDPSSRPSHVPSSIPSGAPSVVESSSPSSYPSSRPSSVPSSGPSSGPTVTASGSPSSDPSSRPSQIPSSIPTLLPSAVPSAGPSAEPSTWPSVRPSSKPSAAPNESPSAAPSSVRSNIPSSMPSSSPSQGPAAQECCLTEITDPNCVIGSDTTFPRPGTCMPNSNCCLTSESNGVACVPPALCEIDCSSVNCALIPSSSPSHSPTDGPTPEGPPVHIGGSIVPPPFGSPAPSGRNEHRGTSVPSSSPSAPVRPIGSCSKSSCRSGSKRVSGSKNQSTTKSVSKMVLGSKNQSASKSAPSRRLRQR